MLLTLNANSLRSMLEKKRSGRSDLKLADLPAFTRETLGLHGLNLPTSLLAGIDRSGLETIRDRADKAGAACLLLIESDPQPLGDAVDARAEGAVERLRVVLQAAQLLGCSSIAVTPAGSDSEETALKTVERLRRLTAVAERAEINILISPGKGVGATPERITDVIKRVGGFRVGTLPDFQAAAGAADPVAYLRRLTPYATVVSASTVQFVAPGGGPPGDAPEAPVEHQSYDLRAMVEAVEAVGFDGTMAIDYRGKGDPVLGVMRSRRMLDAILGGEPTPGELDELEIGGDEPADEAEEE